MSIEELATMLGEQIMAEKASAYDEGRRAACPDPDRCWCSGYTHTPSQPFTPNPYHLKVSA